jgi:hypothetical protein
MISGTTFVGGSKKMTATEEKQMLRDIHKIAIALEKIAKSMNNTLTLKSEPINDTDKCIKADSDAVKYYDDQMLGSAT